MKKIFKEPLVHFLALGALLYFYYASVEPEQSSEILLTLSPYEREQIELNYEKEFATKPSKEYVSAMIEKKRYEKILLSEAQTLKMALQDAQISQLLLKKMEFILANATEFVEPSEEELLEYYKKNIQEYSHVKTLSFVRVYFPNPKDSQVKESYELFTLVDANATLAKAFNSDASLQISFDNVTQEEVKNLFGNYFASKLFMLQSGRWHEAILSSDGANMVYITHKNATDALDFDEVQERVYGDYMTQKREQVKREAYAKLSTQYKFEIE